MHGYHICAFRVHNTPHHQNIAQESRRVNVSTGIQEIMETHAPCARQALLKLCWGLLRALTVQPALILQLVVPQTLHVNVTLDTREQTEAHARSALSTNTKKAWGLVTAPIVHQTLCLQLVVPQTLHVNVTLGTRE